MEIIIAFLNQQPFLALFLVIATGYAIGSINIRGFSLGVGAVIFSGIFIGAIAPKCQPPAMVGTLGLVMFLYGLGVQFGRQFFEGLSGAAGRRLNMLSVLALVAATGVTALEMMLMNVPLPIMVGLFTGAGTSSASMQAAMEAAKSSDPAVGYGIAYPFGVVGAILSIYFMQRIVRPNIDLSSKSGLEMVEVAIHSPEAIGRTLGEVIARMPQGVRVLVARTGNENKHPDPAVILAADDVLLLESFNRDSLEAAQQLLGERATGRLVNDRSRIDYLRVFVSKPNLAGLRLSDLKLPGGIEATITHVQRGDMEMLITPGLILESGDRVGLLTDRKAFPAVRAFFGNSIRGTTEFSYISLGIGMVLGVLVGLIPIPVPVLGTLKVGIAGGSLIVALILGKFGRTWRLTWTMPLSANLTLRNFGLSIFLAQVGMSSGAPFVNVLQDSGVTLLLAGAAILFALAFTPLLIGYYVMRIPFDDLLGLTAGVTGNPAILAYAYRSYPSDRVEICYAMIFPAATILKIMIAQMLIAVGPGG